MSSSEITTDDDEIGLFWRYLNDAGGFISIVIAPPMKLSSVVLIDSAGSVNASRAPHMDRRELFLSTMMPLLNATMSSANSH